MSRRYRAAAAAVGLLLPLGLATTPADAAVRGPFTYAARSSHKCLDVTQSSRAANAPIIQYTCKAVDKRANQNWFHDYTGRVNFRNQHSNKCIDGFHAGGNQVVQWTCDGSSEQRWIVHRVRGGIAFENARYRGLCLDVEKSSTANRARVLLWPCNYHNNQVFD